MPPRKTTPKRRTSGQKASARLRKAPAAVLAQLPSERDAEPLAELPLPPDLATTHVEPAFSRRLPPPEPERPFPSLRRGIFLDVENSSRAAHIARVIEHLSLDPTVQRTDFVAVGNWRVIGHDTARLLARHGAHLVHSAPSVGVRDWSDLRIAVAAGVWLASARPGDLIEVVSDDRAFDAVGDVSASLGITFRRLSYRSLSGHGTPSSEAARAEPTPAAGGGRQRGRRRGRGGWRGRQPAPRSEAPTPIAPPAHDRAAHPAAGEGHTAPHDELVTVVQELIDRAGGRVVTIDALANALKSRGFSRPPGSPRLITRLRRIKELTVSRSGAITLTSGDGGPVEETPEPVSGVRETEESPAERPAWMGDAGEDLSVGPGNEAPRDSGVVAAAKPQAGGARRGRRSRRGGRRHRRRESATPASP